jgi:hypothetical protein
VEFPKTQEGLEAAGYTFNGYGKCKNKGCGAEIGWWETPSHKKIPLDADTFEAHWSTCPGADEFRKKK